MNVTKDNFAAILPLVRTAITEADFVCIDGEFTGLDLGEELSRKTDFLDTIAERYAKNGWSHSSFDHLSKLLILSVSAVRQFSLSQVGVACFKLLEENK